MQRRARAVAATGTTEAGNSEFTATTSATTPINPTRRTVHAPMAQVSVLADAP